MSDQDTRRPDVPPDEPRSPALEKGRGTRPTFQKEGNVIDINGDGDGYGYGRG